MKNKLHSTEGIIRILRQADGGQTVETVCREHNISEATFYRWRKKYSDMDLSDARRLKELAKENAELKKMLAESMLEHRVLKEVNSKKWQALRKSGKPSSMWYSSVCARSVGPVGILACIALRSATAQAAYAPSTATPSADHRSILVVSPVWLSADSSIAR